MNRKQTFRKVLTEAGLNGADCTVWINGPNQYLGKKGEVHYVADVRHFGYDDKLRACLNLMLGMENRPDDAFVTPGGYVRAVYYTRASGLPVDF